MVSISHGIISGPNKSEISISRLLGSPAVIFCSRTTFPSWSKTNKSLCAAPQLVQVVKGDSSAQTGALLLLVQLLNELKWVSFPIPINSTGCPWAL